MDADMQQTQIANEWSFLLQSAQNHASSMSLPCLPAAAELIHKETQKYIDLGAPSTQDELSLRRAQYAELTSRIAAVAQASTSALRHSNVSGSIFDAVRNYLNAPYPKSAGLSTDGLTRRDVLLSTISLLCNSDANVRLRASTTRR